MKTIMESIELSSRLERVGLRVGEALDIGSASIAETWTSDYAELYLVDAAKLTPGDMPDLLGRLDSAVAKRLRQQRDAGRFLDAHVCIMVAGDLIRDENLTRESDASRYVSRKYWIDRDAPIQEILRHLTLTWVDVDASSAGTGADPQQLQGFADLRTRIADRKGAGAASDFIEALAR